MKTSRFLYFPLILALAASFAFGQSSEGNDDPVLRAMRAEMDRSKANLKLGKEPPPYYIEYAITDGEEYVADADFGALQNDLHNRTRILRVLVRVGDYKQDNVSGMNESAISLAPLDNDVAAIRLSIWLATDQAYKRALEQLTAKQAALKQFEADVLPDDFSRATTVKSIQPLVRMDFDYSAWKKNLEVISALYRSDPKIDSFAAALRATSMNRYFLNSEGSETRTGTISYLYNIQGSTQAPDGMRLDRSSGKMFASTSELPSVDSLKKEAKELMGTLAALRQAPIVEEEYRGPVLVSPDASGDILQALVGENVLARRPRPGDTSRVIGAFANEYKSRVLPDFVSVVDDSTKTELNGHFLAGSYKVDDEAVKAQPVVLVEKGQLVNYLTSRQPVRDFPTSNGHGRATAVSIAQPALGNLFITSSDGLDPAKLKQKFIEACKNRGSKYCYRVETVTPRLLPRLLYRVYVSDGHEELVRGAKFDQLDTRALRSDLLAMGNDLQAFNFAAPIPHSVIVPSLLFQELEVKRANAPKEKLPDYPAPELKGN